MSGIFLSLTRFQSAIIREVGTVHFLIDIYYLLIDPLIRVAFAV